jgi:hypothetical protein
MLSSSVSLLGSRLAFGPVCDKDCNLQAFCDTAGPLLEVEVVKRVQRRLEYGENLFVNQRKPLTMERLKIRLEAAHGGDLGRLEVVGRGLAGLRSAFVKMASACIIRLINAVESEA